MSIKIHHGEPGSYKTSGAMSDDILPLILKESGRLIITNVRGFTRDQVIENFPDLDEDKIKIINIDTDDPKGREKMSKWFHWAENGAFFLIDEAQMVFPKKWDKKYIESLDYEGGENKAFKDNRPHDWSTAWEKHRHYNWDFILTTPHIKKIRVDIRECSSGGFYHKDQGTIGFKGRYKESYHPAVDSPTPSNVISVAIKKVNKNVWNLYQSTATNEFLETTSGIKIWKDPKLLFSVILLLFLIGFGISGFLNSNIIKASDKHDKELAEQNNKSSRKVSINDHKTNIKTNDINFNNVDNLNKSENNANLNPFNKGAITEKDFIPVIAHIPASAPIYKDIWIPVSFPKLSCIASRKRCLCHTQQGNRYKIEDKFCRSYANNEFFDFTIPNKNSGQPTNQQSENTNQGVTIKDRHIRPPLINQKPI